MIHLSLPLRPRINVRCESLLTPISISLAKEGKKILCLTDIKSTENFDISEKYVKVVSDKLENFDLVIKDSDPKLINFTTKIISEKILPYVKKMNVRTCKCGSYEELENVNSFNLRKVKENTCVLCGEILREKNMEVLLSDITWPKKENFSYNYNWSEYDFTNFLSRQKITHKISKKNEVLKFSFNNLEFGIRYQVLWAAMIVYIAKIENDNDVTLHYVNKVQDKAFFVCSLVKMMNPDINFHLKAIPVVWVEDSPLISNCLPSHIKLLGKAINTKRKELKVSLKSWRK